ncbi:MAG TPA: NAD-dependent epimerase/dehydratase family protein [Candidatus Nitrosotalea sp.]|nr:NAD-dependent epimerase/dehydratase family protein [Candidatus Nitrosotalea sp.]
MKKISKVVVTGGAGFIGSHIVDELIKREIETYVVDNLSTGSLENLKQHQNNKLLHVIIGDARYIENLLEPLNDIDVVFHEAAIANVARSVSEPMVVHDVNVNTSLEVMNFCVKNNVKRFVFASSAAVYGVTDNNPTSEDRKCKPFSPYGASKLAIEDYLYAYHNTYGLETAALRYFNVYGPRQLLNDYSGVITVFINQLLNDVTPTIHGDGLQTRDFVHVKDIVRANMLCMESSKAVGEVFNVATQNPISILQLLLTLKSIIKPDAAHKFGPTRLGDVKFGYASIEKIRTALGFEPKFTVSNNVVDVVEYIKLKPEIKTVTK